MFKEMVQVICKLLIQLIIVSVSCTFTIETVFAAPNVEGIQVYQNSMHLSPEHKQKLADDITRYRNADNLWDALREEFALPHYEDSPAVQAKIEWYMNNQDFLLRSALRAAPYLYYISQQVKKRHLPAELVLLPIIESGYDPFSLSNMGAAGIWQLMPGTATGLGIKRDFWYDGRRDVIASTRAALNYLAYLQSFFDGNWLLATAAYNTGEGNVLTAIKKNIRDGRDTDFWSLPLAQQTKDYVPSLLALAVIISHPDQYPIYFPPVRNAPYLGQVEVSTQLNLKYAAQLAGISYKKMIQLNPGFNRPSTAAKGYKLILPIENVEQFSENLSSTPLSRQINWIHYKMKTGDTLLSVAKKFNTSPTAIRKLNHLGKNNLRRGYNLLIPTEGRSMNPAESMPEDFAANDDNDNSNTSNVEAPKPFVVAKPVYAEKNDVSEAPVEEAAMPLEATPQEHYTLQPGDTIYMVRSKDTIESLARRFHLNEQALMSANQLTSKRLKPGNQLIIPTHNPAFDPNTVAAAPAKSLQPGDTIYMVRNGDTVEKIARKFRTSAAAIRLANLVDDTSLSEGEKLVIPTHMRG